MHVDPDSTDAFNALFLGHKWWVYLPPDVYEFNEELSCDEKCSEITGSTRQHVADQLNGLWFEHILPQIRLVVYS